MNNHKLKLFMVGGWLIILSASLMGCLSTGKEAFTPGYVPTMSPLRLYDLEQEVTFTGQIIEIVNDTTPPPIQIDEGSISYDDERTLISVVVTTYKEHQDHTYLVQLGPKWYLELKGIHLLKKKNITVTASPVKTPNLVDKRGAPDLYKEDAIMLARVAQMGDYKITLRDQSGVPVWYKRGRTKGILDNWQMQLKQEEMKGYMQDMMKEGKGSQKLPANE